jgi:fumarate hydratase class I
VDPDTLKKHLLELIRMTACDLAPDVEQALAAARDREEGRARSTLDWMIKNSADARESSMPVCQDTGSLIFYVDHGKDIRPGVVAQAAREAAAAATEASYLRPNAVHPLTGKNTGNNIGQGTPYFHFHEVEDDRALRVRLMLKGGGSENCGAQYTLPDASIKAARDLQGVKRCILNAALRAQGFGCAPGVLGVGIGGDRMTSFMESKEQFFRKLDDKNPDPGLAELEELFRVGKLHLLGLSAPQPGDRRRPGPLRLIAEDQNDRTQVAGFSSGHPQVESGG